MVRYKEKVPGTQEYLTLSKLGEKEELVHSSWLVVHRQEILSMNDELITNH